jgi:predicted XRE-type DNA-binding protein
MSKKRFVNMWDAIEDTPAQAENMKLRSALIMALKDHIARTGLSQSEAAKLLGVTQPRISDLMRGSHARQDRAVWSPYLGQYDQGCRLAC